MKTSYTDKPSFFRWVNSYDGELIIKKNQIFSTSGELLCEFNNTNDQNLLKAVKAKAKVRKALIDYFTELTKAAGVIEQNDDMRLVYHDDMVFYSLSQNNEMPITDLTLDQLMVMGTVFK